MSDTLNELFARDPDQLTHPDIETLIAEYRARRAQFKADEAAGKRGKGSKGKKAEPVTVDLAEISFD